MAWIYLGLVLFIVIFFFIVVKRPMYEVMFLAFLALLLVSGNIGKLGYYLIDTSKSYLLFTMMAFMMFGVIVEKSGIINELLNMIVAVVGRFSGGAGYVTLLAGAAMGAFCGTGSGTVAATGSFMIPAMKKTGFSAELSATISAAAGTLGPIIPPSAAIPVMYMMLEAVAPDYCTASQFWMFAWPVSFWLIIQRLITLYILIRKNKVTPIPKEERVSLKVAFKHGWKTLILPLIMILPFIFDNMFKDTLITERLGTSGAEQFSMTVLLVVPCVACLVAILLWKEKGNRVTFQTVGDMLVSGVTVAAPIILMTFSGFAMGTLITDLGLAESIVADIRLLDIPRTAVIIVAPLIFTFFGMFMESSSVYFLFGPVFIPIAISVGINPMMAAMMVNVMSNGMGQMSPPFALCLLVAMGIADSDFKKTSYQAIIWCVTQYIVIVLMLAGLLPMFGMMW
ncbi:TRAP transporter large permease subunit [Mediterraneibacter sp. NSJ-55]|uniref:TRAP transporter large permease subunit n=1 Tax=Mediterraneibacter hominis TaxID=2763054 RepID=A0A923LK06_9FIRM|nr:TRAP transporter large permease subunit [Mediterraneibacter hominis]MBC5689659.1 TRAP transporter large permease subunit [Mediterraneibacter hominis]